MFNEQFNEAIYPLYSLKKKSNANKYEPMLMEYVKNDSWNKWK